MYSYSISSDIRLHFKSIHNPLNFNWNTINKVKGVIPLPYHSEIKLKFFSLPNHIRFLINAWVDLAAKSAASAPLSYERHNLKISPSKLY